MTNLRHLASQFANRSEEATIVKENAFILEKKSRDLLAELTIPYVNITKYVINSIFGEGYNVLKGS